MIEPHGAATFPSSVCERELLPSMSGRSGFSFPSSRARERAEEEVDEVAKEKEVEEMEEEEEEEWEAGGGRRAAGGGPRQGYFYEARNKDMEIKHLYAT